VGKAFDWAIVPQALDVTVADLHGHGHLDVIATAWTKQGRIAWFDNAGDPTGPWTMHSLINDWDGTQTIAVDLDNDGKVDSTLEEQRAWRSALYGEVISWKAKPDSLFWKPATPRVLAAQFLPAL
jgi:hypothetical protein